MCILNKITQELFKNNVTNVTSSPIITHRHLRLPRQFEFDRNFERGILKTKKNIKIVYFKIKFKNMLNFKIHFKIYIF